jgi:hypothetical protein
MRKPLASGATTNMLGHRVSNGPSGRQSATYTTSTVITRLAVERCADGQRDM